MSLDGLHLYITLTKTTPSEGTQLAVLMLVMVTLLMRGRQATQQQGQKA